MITETRRIAFSNETLINVLTMARDKAVTQRLPPGVIDEIKLHDASAPKVTARINVLGGGKYQHVTFPQSELAAMLIVYCKSKKIPLPRNASKSFEINQGALTLTIRQHYDD